MNGLSIVVPYFQDFKNLIICMESIQYSYSNLNNSKNKIVKFKIIT